MAHALVIAAEGEKPLEVEERMMPVVDEFGFAMAPVRGAAGPENRVLCCCCGTLEAGPPSRRHGDDDGGGTRGARLLHQCRDKAVRIGAVRIDAHQPPPAGAKCARREIDPSA